MPLTGKRTEANRTFTYMYDGTYWVWLGCGYEADTVDPRALGFGYGTCDTAAATAAKVVTLASYILRTGGYVSVRFTYDVPANATLNINSKGAKAIWYRNKAIAANVIKGGDMATFVFDGTYYRLVGIDRASYNKDSVVSLSDLEFHPNLAGKLNSSYGLYGHLISENLLICTMEFRSTENVNIPAYDQTNTGGLVRFKNFTIRNGFYVVNMEYKNEYIPSFVGSFNYNNAGWMGIVLRKAITLDANNSFKLSFFAYVNPK